MGEHVARSVVKWHVKTNGVTNTNQQVYRQSILRSIPCSSMSKHFTSFVIQPWCFELAQMSPRVYKDPRRVVYCISFSYCLRGTPTPLLHFLALLLGMLEKESVRMVCWYDIIVSTHWIAFMAVTRCWSPVGTYCIGSSKQVLLMNDS